MLFKDRLGSFVDRRNDDDIHICNQCDRPKLWVNTQKGLWHCWWCCEGGRTRAAPNSEAPVFPTVFEDQLPEIRVSGTSTDIPPIRGYTGAQLTDAGMHFFLKFTNPCWVLPLTHHGLPVGQQVYDPKGNVKYRTTGHRGLHYKFTLELGYPLILCEGFFDYVAWCCVSLKCKVNPVFLAGNSLTAAQRGDIIRAGVSEVYLALDSDLMAPLIKMHHQLEPFIDNVYNWPPPLEFKDWDEAYQDNIDHLLLT